ncbi:hypothetical protein GCM10018782_40640 [Streptomyces griseoaurantiacus]|nr:hypothetical protein GCM10018782_40640 [Streptomyces griseoaurantiacus]
MSSAREEAWPEATSSRTRAASGEVPLTDAPLPGFSLPAFPFSDFPFTGRRFRALISVMYEVTSAAVVVTKTVRPRDADGNRLPDGKTRAERGFKQGKCGDLAS